MCLTGTWVPAPAAALPLPPLSVFNSEAPCAGCSAPATGPLEPWSPPEQPHFPTTPQRAPLTFESRCMLAPLMATRAFRARVPTCHGWQCVFPYRSLWTALPPPSAPGVHEAACLLGQWLAHPKGPPVHSFVHTERPGTKQEGWAVSRSPREDRVPYEGWRVSGHPGATQPGWSLWGQLWVGLQAGLPQPLVPGSRPAPPAKPLFPIFLGSWLVLLRFPDF